MLLTYIEAHLDFKCFFLLIILIYFVIFILFGYIIFLFYENLQTVI